MVTKIHRAWHSEKKEKIIALITAKQSVVTVLGET
jgi:hypothetical protein